MLPTLSGYRLPGEYESHRATWILWPTRPDNWRREGYFAKRDTLSLVAWIAHYEPVRLGVPPGLAASLSRSVPPNTTVVELPFNDTWVRDTGPTLLVSEHRPTIAIDWRFNSWGGLFSQSSEDDQVASLIADHEQLDVLRAPIVLEGGAVVTDGRHTIVVTEESVIAENRNPGLTRNEAERIFRHYLGAERVLWVPRGLADDESGGHIDNVCAFTSDRVMLVADTKDPSHPSFGRLQAAQKVLRESVSTQGLSYEIALVPLPAPTAIRDEEARGFAAPNGAIVRTAGTPLAPSYINYYATGKAVFVPLFEDPHDAHALDVIGRAFRGRQIVPFPSREFLLGGGAIHCLTREIP